MDDNYTIEQQYAEIKSGFETLSPSERLELLDVLEKQNGTKWMEGFMRYLSDTKNMNYSEDINTEGYCPECAQAVQDQKNVIAPELPYGRVGMDSTKSVPENDAVVAPNAQPEYEIPVISETVNRMRAEFMTLPPSKQEEMLADFAKTQGQQFSENVSFLFSDREFSEYIADATQIFYDTLAHDFCESRDKVGYATTLANFSETTSNAVLSHVSGVRPSAFSILDAAVYLTDVFRKDFAEKGDLASALEEVTPASSEEAVEVAAPNLEDKGPELKDIVDPGTIEMLIDTYRSLISEDQKADFKESVRKLFPTPVYDYIISKIIVPEQVSETVVADKGFAEDAVNPVEDSEVQKDLVEVSIPLPESNEYEIMSKKFLGPEAYTVDPVGIASQAQAPNSIAALPEGAVALGGTTLAEDYQRDAVLDKYEELSKNIQ